jgi:hypothetical protein
VKKVILLVLLLVGGASLWLKGPAPVDCGCVNRKTCVEPCSFCCGPGGIAACFSNLDPSACKH